MPKQLPVRSCPSCKGWRVKKNGVTSAGTPRYRYLDCGACHTKQRVFDGLCVGIHPA
ncbi:transposase-like zinc-binding domain-containing protein [Gleimia europaea]|uniref:transposase-like zinc-binding domain-containing protein n=1 Tax=Gleimia europaea TaxID=66228 RepID=UPI003D9C06DF